MTGLAVPDVSKGEMVPPGWFEQVAAPTIEAIDDWEELDETDARIHAMASYIESFDPDEIQFEQAKRLIEKRRGDLLPLIQQGHRSDLGLLPRVKEVDINASEPTQSRWRKLARHWDDILWPVVVEATSKKEISQTQLLRIIDGRTEGDEWFTPPWLFEALGIRYSVDVCAPIDPALRTAPADEFYTTETDGLLQDWHGTVWCNPPYSTPAAWADKMIQHNDGLLLSHVPMNAEWASDVWQACQGIRLFQAMEFLRANGDLQRPGYWLQLAAFGDTAYHALERLIPPPKVAENPRRIPSPLWTR